MIPNLSRNHVPYVALICQNEILHMFILQFCYVTAKKETKYCDD